MSCSEGRCLDAEAQADMAQWKGMHNGLQACWACQQPGPENVLVSVRQEMCSLAYFESGICMVDEGCASAGNEDAPPQHPIS
jgi:hypothetical protein